MQSWQADLVNASLSISLKPALRRVSSLRAIRTAVNLVDNTMGRLAVPKKIEVSPTEDSGVACDMEWIQPQSQGGSRQRVILYLPGGAYIIRTPKLHRGLVARICAAAGASALMCFYRLAPEHPFPACLEDALGAYDYLRSHGVAAADIVVAGDSAGGGLALALLLKLRDSGRELPACAVLASPLLDACDHAPSRTKNSASDSALPHPRERAINPRALFAGEYDPTDPLISPVNGTFEGLPPIYVLVSDSEMLLDDSLRLARKANMYRTQVKVDIWHKLPHVWLVFPFLPEAVDGIARIASFIGEHLPAAAKSVA